MKKIITIATLSALCASTLFAFDGKVLKERSDTGYSYEGKIEYKIPDEKTIPNNQFGDLVKYGKELIINTSKHIGPEIDDPSMRFS
jgi:thiosulfate dehydrogenase